MIRPSLALALAATLLAGSLPAFSSASRSVAADGWTYTVTPGGASTRLVARAGAERRFARVLQGTWSLDRLGDRTTPVVGLAPDRSLLALRAPTTTSGTSRFLLVDPRAREGAGAIFDVAGAMRVDAVSPRGRWLYLTEQLGAESYAVRAYDVRKARLLAEPVVVKSVSGAPESMLGTPVARATTDHGEYVSTLYDGRHAFVHVLWTERRFAICVDLPLHGRGAARGLRLRERGDGRVEIGPPGGAPRWVLDPESGRVTVP